MTPARLANHAWIPTLLLSLGFFFWITQERIQAVERLTLQADELPAADPRSPTGYEGGRRVLMAPGNNWESYQWIMQTQQLLASGEVRLRHVSYDNAPDGRTVESASPYRWWMSTLARVEHTFSGRPLGQSVERAALWSDPLLLVVFLLVTTVLARRFLGPAAAAVFPAAAVVLYPFAGTFLPGAPDDIGASLLASAGTVLCLAIAVRRGSPPFEEERRWFAASGVLGGLGLWLSVNSAVPVIAGVFLGALAWQSLRPADAERRLAWRTWGLVGALTTLVAWLLEYAPGSLSVSPARLNGVHPLYALSWLCAGECLRMTGSRPLRALLQDRRAALRLLILAAGVLAVPLLMLMAREQGFLMRDTFALRLSALSPELEARNAWQWLGAEPGYSRLVALLLPVMVALTGSVLWWRAAGQNRGAVLLVASPLLVVATWGLFELGRWNQVGALLLVFVLTLLARDRADTVSPNVRRGWMAALCLSLLPGALLLATSRKADTTPEAERDALLERDIAYWLAKRGGAEGVVALAPPRMTVSLIYHGGVKGLGSPYQENREGFATAVRLAGSTTADEAHAIVRQRGVTHILMPSWDAFLHEYARLAGAPPEASLVGMLHRWLPPRWLKPSPYLLPATPDLADDRLVVFETTEVQSPALALSRLTEYFLEMQQPGLAARAAQALGAQHAGDLSALVARARVELARRDADAVKQTLQAIAVELKEGTDETLTWDRRVSLCLLLAELGVVPSAKVQAQRCLDEMGEKELGSLSERTLVRFITLCKALQLQPANSEFLDQAKGRLPRELRSRL